MKRYVLLLALMTLFAATPLTARSVGYGFGYYGEELTDSSARLSSGVEISLVYRPLLLSYGNPALVGKVALGTDQDKAWLVPYVQAGVSFELCRITDHPFNFIGNNVVAYSPSVGISYQYDPERELGTLTMEASVFKLSQKDFWYEFLTPFITLRLDDASLDGWGLNLVRYTYFLK
ncbi:MAG: hypothetical protein AB7D92_05175 [Sphaerochaeta sp.]